MSSSRASWRARRQQLLPLVPTAEAVDAELCRRHLRRFLAGAWPVVEPATQFVGNWHIDAIAEHLEAVARREILQLVINVPPGFMKSLLVGVLFPAWIWADRPAARFLTTSYAEKLAVRDCVKSRRLIQSEWYGRRWGDVFQLTSDQNEKTRYENDRTGLRVAAGVHSATGERADFIIADDPHNIEDIESLLERESVHEAWDQVLSQRMADPATCAKLLVMQRLHPEDLTGHVTERGGWEVLRLPMEWDGRAMATSLGHPDPRTRVGELLWPARYPAGVVAQQKRDLGPYGAPAQLQQDPIARTGGLFQAGWFEIVSAAPAEGMVARARYWDKAGSKKSTSAKRTCGVRMARHSSGIYYIEDVRKGYWPAPEREAEIRTVAQLDALQCGGRLAVYNYVETEPGASGKESTEGTIRGLPGYLIEGDRPTGDKFVRATPLSDAARVGNVKLVRGPWNKEFLDELEAARPGARLLDQMDAAAGAFNKLAAMAPSDAGPEQVYDAEEEGGFVL